MTSWSDLESRYSAATEWALQYMRAGDYQLAELWLEQAQRVACEMAVHESDVLADLERGGPS
jgi:hypothetical protein